MSTVLISGAGIAGPALAFWLTKSGYQVTIVEVADGIRPGGQTVDLRGAGGDVVERMGLINQMRQRSLHQRGVAWIKADGSRRADMPVTAFHGNGLVSKLEILRGDLVDVLYQATKRQTDYRFNTRIEDLSENDDGVSATLSDGSTLSAMDRIRRSGAWCSGAKISSSNRSADTTRGSPHLTPSDLMAGI
jgi:2-polyprenyl-6-methoxyphenol hydroxylase-like FAD-dependent oxidoreductase